MAADGGGSRAAQSPSSSAATAPVPTVDPPALASTQEKYSANLISTVAAEKGGGGDDNHQLIIRSVETDHKEKKRKEKEEGATHLSRAAPVCPKTKRWLAATSGGSVAIKGRTTTAGRGDKGVSCEPHQTKPSKKISGLASRVAVAPAPGLSDEGRPPRSPALLELLSSPGGRADGPTFIGLCLEGGFHFHFFYFLSRISTIPRFLLDKLVSATKLSSTAEARARPAGHRTRLCTSATSHH